MRRTLFIVFFAFIASIDAFSQHGPNWKLLGVLPATLPGGIGPTFFIDSTHGIVSDFTYLYVTTDGKTWKKANSPNANGQITAIRLVAGKLYATATPDVLVSGDNGANWTWAGLGPATQVTDVYEDPNGNVRTLPPYGATFTRLDKLHCFATRHGVPRWTGGPSVGPLLSPDGGLTWPDTIPGSNDTWGAYADSCAHILMYIDEHPDYGHQQVYRSVDQGASWTPAGNFDSPLLEGLNGIAYAWGSEGLSRSSDYGRSWLTLGGAPILPYASTIFHFAVFGARGECVAIGVSDSIWMTTNGGGIPLPGDLTLPKISSFVSSCGSRSIPVVLRQAGAVSAGNDSVIIETTVRDSLGECTLIGSSQFVIKGGASDTLWLRYSPRSSPGVSHATIAFHKYWHCTDWVDTSWVTITSPPSARLSLPKTMHGSCKEVTDFGLLTLDSCQTLVITQIDVTPPVGPRFSILRLLPDTVHYADTLPIKFDPLDTTADGFVSIHLHGHYLGSDSTFDTTMRIHLVASPSAPSLNAQISSVDFGSRSTCDPAVDTTISFTNAGCTPDTVTQSLLTDPAFAISPNPVGTVIPPDSSVTFHIRFKVSSGKPYSANVILVVRSLGAYDTATVLLAATGVQGMGQLNLTSTSLPAGAHSSCHGDTSFSTSMFNSGCDTLVITNLRLEDDSAFSLASSFADSLLPPNGSDSIAFRFAPRISGSHSATLTFHTRNLHGNDVGHDTTIYLDGVGITPPMSVALSASSLSLPSVVAACGADTASVSFTNTSCYAVTIDSVTGLSAPFELLASFKGGLPTDSSRTWQLRYAPTAQGSDLSSLIIHYHGQDGIEYDTTVNISATASAQPRVTMYVKPGSLQAVNQQLDTIPVYVSSTGSSREIRSIGFQTLRFRLNVRTDLLTPESVLISIPNASASIISTDMTGANIAISVPSDFAPTSETLLASVVCLTYLTDTFATDLTLSNLECSASSQNCFGLDSNMDQIAFTYLPFCGNTTISRVLAKRPFEIESIVPNPAKDEIRVVVALRGDDPVRGELFDVLGSKSLEVMDVRSTSLRVGELPAGTYYLRLSSEGYVVTRRVVIER